MHDQIKELRIPFLLAEIIESFPTKKKKRIEIFAFTSVGLYIGWKILIIFRLYRYMIWLVDSYYIGVNLTFSV